jgi:hypothetical protein
MQTADLGREIRKRDAQSRPLGCNPARVTVQEEEEKMSRFVKLKYKSGEECFINMDKVNSIHYYKEREAWVLSFSGEEFCYIDATKEEIDRATGWAA